MLTFLIVWSVLATIAVIFAFISRREYSAVCEDIDRMREDKESIIYFLHKSAESLSTGDLDKNKLYRIIVRTTAITCGAMSACVYEKISDDKLIARAMEGLFPPQSKKIRKQKDSLRSKFLEEAIVQETLEIGSGIIGSVAKNMRGVFVKRARNDKRVIEHEDDSLKVRSLIAVPVVFRGKLYGVLAVSNPISGKPFKKTDYALALSLGEQAGMAIHNMDAVSAIFLKRKMEFDLRLASNVQKYLLPSRMPDTDSLKFAVKYIPQLLIGGDFYDFYELPNGKIGITVGDVSGKGVSAAMIMAICRTKMQSLALKNKSPAETLKELNAEIFDSMRADMFVTMIYAIIDVTESKIILARAGHEPALICKASTNETAKIRGAGMAVGMVESEIFDESIEDVEVEFNQGDSLVLYTDGITEATNKSGEEYSTNRLAIIMPQLSTHTPQEMCDAIVKDVERFSDHTKYADDITLLCVKRI